MNPFYHIAAALGAGLLLVSCQSFRITEPQRDLPPEAVPATYVATEPTTVTMPDRWWEAFGSQELNGLMDRAFAGNLSLAQAWTQLRQAQAAATATAADGKLQVTGSGNASSTETHGDTHTTSRSHTLGLGVSYEVDLWGRIAATTDAARLAAMASEQDVRATALTLSSEIAQGWVAVKSYQAQLALVEEQLRAANEYLELLKVRQRKAMSDLLDVLQQRQDVAGLESTVESLRGNLAVARLELAYLLGLPDDSALALAPDGLPALPPLPAAGLPSELLARRPDIAAALLRLRAQEQTVAAARAARLPSLSLTGSATFSSGQLNELFDNWITNLAAGLSAPLLDGSRLAAEEAGAKAQRDEYLVAYRDTALGAFVEVNTALVRERAKQAYLDRVTTEAAYAAETLDANQQHYLKGKVTYLSVLTAFTSKQTAERSLVTAQADLLTNRIALCAALGGTWMESLREAN